MVDPKNISSIELISPFSTDGCNPHVLGTHDGSSPAKLPSARHDLKTRKVFRFFPGNLSTFSVCFLLFSLFVLFIENEFSVTLSGLIFVSQVIRRINFRGIG